MTRISALRSMTSWVLRPVLGSSVAVDTARRSVAFTFDDGPDPDGTPIVLDVLREHAARATFFVLGARVIEHPDLVRRIDAEGHELGLHGHEHVTLPELGPLAQLRMLVEGRRALQATIGRAPRLFRAPYGLQTPATVAFSRLLRMQPVMWSSHAAEWTERPLAECRDLAEPGIRPGGIVLLHDGSAGRNERPRRPVPEVAALLDQLLDLADDRRLDGVPVGELLAHGRPERRFWYRSWRV